FGAAFSALDAVDGGAGADTTTLSGNYAAGIVFTPTTMMNVEKISLGSGFSYSLKINDATIAAGQTLTVDGVALGAGNTLNLDGSAETNGNLNVVGGAGNDTVALGNG